MSVDDRIRRALEEALPAPDADPSVADRLVERSQIAETGAGPEPSGGGEGVGAGPGGGPHIWFGIGGVALGVAAGILAAVLTGGGGGGVGGVLPLDAVPIYSCPGAGEIGSLHRGDRVLIVGQADGWLAVRNVRGAGEVVFVEAAHVVADGDVSGLPHRDCEPSGSVTVDTTTTTSVPDTTTTTVQATTTTSAPTTTTSPGDDTAPVISNAAANPTEIWEEDTELIACPPAYPRESTISAFITDDVSVTSVTASWTLPDEPQTTVPMTGGPTYTATFGPFEGETLPTTQPFDHDLTITIRARDAAGNVGTTTVVVKVWSIWSCFD